MKIIVLSRHQTESSCRLNSSAAAAIIMSNSLMFHSPAPLIRPALIAYTDLLQTLGTLLNTLELRRPFPDALLEAFDKGTPSLQDIQFLNKRIQQDKTVHDAVIASLKAYQDGVPGFQALASRFEENETDKLGLLSHYEKMEEESHLHLIYKRFELMIRRSEQVYRSDSQFKNTGIYLETAQNLLSQPQVLAELSPESEKIEFIKVGLDYSQGDKDKIDETIDQFSWDNPIQITAGGHAVVYGRTMGVYWKFDSTGKPDHNPENPLSFSTLTVYENQEEAIASMKKIMPDLIQKQSRNRTVQFAEIQMTLKSSEEILSDQARIVNKLQSDGEKIQKYADDFLKSTLIDNPTKRFDACEIADQYMKSLLSILKKSFIPDIYPDLQEELILLSELAQAHISRHQALLREMKSPGALEPAVEMQEMRRVTAVI